MIVTMKWAEWAPGVAQVRDYRRAWLRGDLLAGLTVAAYLVPAGDGLCGVGRRATGRRVVGRNCAARRLRPARIVTAALGRP